MKYYHNQHIGVYENAFSDEWCNKIIDYFNVNYSESFLRSSDDGAQLGTRDRTVEINNQSLQEEFCTVFENTIYPLYQHNYFFGPPKTFNYTGFKIQKTFPTEGYHVWHAELPSTNHVEEKELMTRFGVYTLYLNDVEEGGETEFLYQSLRIPPKKGTLCIFPSYFTHIHRGNPPLSGEKYILTGWINLQDFSKLN